jgi:hypothetical protein
MMTLKGGDIQRFIKLNIIFITKIFVFKKNILFNLSSAGLRINVARQIGTDISV